MTRLVHLSMASAEPTPARPNSWKRFISGMKPLIMVPVLMPYFWILRKLSTRFHTRDCFWSWTTLESEVNCSDGLELFRLIGSSECCLMDAQQLGPEWFPEFHKGLYSDHYGVWSLLDIGDNLDSPSRLFADDSVIYREISESADCAAVQEDLARLYNWTQKWQLALNLSKCKVICISNKRKPPTYTYRLNNVAIECVDTFKYLGVRINPELKRGDHVTDVAAKANRILNLLRRTMYGCSKGAKKWTYLALVRPHFEYCAPVRSSHQIKDSEKLEKVQRRAARWIDGRWDPVPKKWSKSYEICHKLHMPTLHRRRLFLIRCQVYNLIHKLDFIPFSKYLGFTRSSCTRFHNLTLLGR